MGPLACAAGSRPEWVLPSPPPSPSSPSSSLSPSHDGTSHAAQVHIHAHAVASVAHSLSAAPSAASPATSAHTISTTPPDTPEPEPEVPSRLNFQNLKRKPTRTSVAAAGAQERRPPVPARRRSTPASFLASILPVHGTGPSPPSPVSRRTPLRRTPSLAPIQPLQPLIIASPSEAEPPHPARTALGLYSPAQSDSGPDTSIYPPSHRLPANPSLSARRSSSPAVTSLPSGPAPGTTPSVPLSKPNRAQSMLRSNSLLRSLTMSPSSDGIDTGRKSEDPLRATRRASSSSVLLPRPPSVLGGLMPGSRSFPSAQAGDAGDASPRTPNTGVRPRSRRLSSLRMNPFRSTASTEDSSASGSEVEPPSTPRSNRSSGSGRLARVQSIITPFTAKQNPQPKELEMGREMGGVDPLATGTAEQHGSAPSPSALPFRIVDDHQFLRAIETSPHLRSTLAPRPRPRSLDVRPSQPHEGESTSGPEELHRARTCSEFSAQGRPLTWQPDELWSRQVKVLFLIRELIQTERSYAGHLQTLLVLATATQSARRPGVGAVPGPWGRDEGCQGLLCAHLPSLLRLSQTLLALLERAPTPTGVGTAFTTAAPLLESALVAWSKAAPLILLALHGTRAHSTHPPHVHTLARHDRSSPRHTRRRTGISSGASSGSNISGKLAPIDLAIMPTQRLPRYILLLRQLHALVAEVPGGSARPTAPHGAGPALADALGVCARVADLCNGQAPPPPRRS